MPNRIIREGLLDSERYWSVTIEARLLFVHLLLLADDFGCVSLAPVFIRRRCFDDRPSDEKVSKLLGELADADLIRIYEIEGGRYGFVPRFRQRLQRETLRHPAPPSALLAGDADAEEKFRKIKHKTEKATVAPPLPTVPQPPEEKRREEKKNLSTPIGVLVPDDPEGSPEPPARPGVPDCPAGDIVETYHAALPTLPRVRVLTDARRAALRSRWREMHAAGKFQTEAEGLERFKRFFEYVGQSAFLLGDGPQRNGSPPFQADLEWLTKPGNFAKVIEGRYHR